jgi:pyranose oxidase
MTKLDTEDVDVLVVGSGPVGCTFARCLVPEGYRVLIAEAGASLSPRPGEHLKNAFVYQRDVDKFTSIVQGLLNTLSISPRRGYTNALDPISFRTYRDFIRSGQNPRQDPRKNLDAAAASYGVGGMFTHWTNNTPRHHPTMERIPLISGAEWDILYRQAELILNTRRDVFSGSIRHTVVKEALRDHYGTRLQPPFDVQELPVAGERRSDNDEFVRFTGVDTVLAGLIDEPEKYSAKQFQIRPHHRVKRLVVKGDRIDHAIVEDLMEWRTLRIHADLFVVAAGAILTPQILWNSEIRPIALGRYLTEHPMTFTQIVLRQSIIDGIRNDPRFSDRVRRVEPLDPIPIPMQDPPPMVWIPVSEGRPWHCQVHRDSFQYGALPPDIDDRLVVDLRWFGMVDPVAENRVYFEDDLHDKFGMPQPTFEFVLGEGDRQRAHAMLSDMVEAAHVLGGFLTGAEPRFMPPGSSLHFQGTSRMGDKDDGTSVVDPNSKVWGFRNLYLGGNGVIPTRTAANPTLTSVALAVRSASSILDKRVEVLGSTA